MPSNRFALGAVQPHADHRPVLWALLESLRCRSFQTQVFLSQSRFVCSRAVLGTTGQDYRHLDSWLMSSDLCGRLFGLGTRTADCAIVEGHFDVAKQSPERGGSLDKLCDWLNLPKMVVIDARRVGPCMWPRIPSGTSAIFLDHVPENRTDALRLIMSCEIYYGVPVVGWLPEMAEIRAELSNESDAGLPHHEIYKALQGKLESTIDWSKFFKSTDAPPLSFSEDDSANSRQRPPLNIAVAYDEAFRCYFTDTLEMLESCGGIVRDFSPLHGDGLPAGTDLVYIGCGPAESHARALASNCCTREAIRRHVRQGGRVYAEGSGMAYLCRRMITSSGSEWPMVGVLPADAERNQALADVQPATVTLKHSCWLGEAKSKLRGYLNTNWVLRSSHSLKDYVSEPHYRNDLVGFGNALGSRLHLNFAAQSDILSHFFRPQASIQTV